jgi:hypothetical protein
MDSVIVYALAGIVILIVMIVLTVRGGTIKVVQSKEDKRVEIVSGYKKQLKEALAPHGNDKQARITIKNRLLKKFSDEISQNIFFDKNEIREIILELSKN